MTNPKKTEPLAPAGKTAVTLSPDGLQAATGTDHPGLQTHLLTQLVQALWIPAGLSAEETQTRVETVVALLRGIRPLDEVEGMLAIQMVATHDAAMECLRRSMLPQQTFEAREMNLRNSQKLLAMYARQLEVLDKHRGKGQQQVTVKHINVEPGGQAVVGTVQTSPQSRDPSDRKAPPTLADQSGRSFEIDAKPVPPKKSAKRRR